MLGIARNGIALVRPPGHHAEAHVALGFGVLNSVALAARHARTALGARRVLIVDWDIHHGNGIQHAFESDPSVLYFSVHRYEHGYRCCLSSPLEPLTSGKLLYSVDALPDSRDTQENFFPITACS